MIQRYSLPRMRALWSDERKLQIWLEIEIAVCDTLAELGKIPAEDAAQIRERARFSLEEISEIEKRTNHDVIAFLENVAGYVGPAARWIHHGLTSSDILDTTLAVQMNTACGIFLDDLHALREAVAQKARMHKLTPMIGRSHGVHAEPLTFGLKMALMYDEFGRAIQRLMQVRERVRVGKLSGAVGTHAHLDPEVEARVCKRLDLSPEAISTQIVQRDRHAEFLTTLAIIASSVDRWATEFRHLQRTEVLEVEEFFHEGQKGSSAMPHKRNPITSEKLSGLARVIRGNAVAALENVALWHERDISHSSVERIIFPDSCMLLDYMLVTLKHLVEQLQIHPENMQRNLEKTRGLHASQTILLRLIETGMERQQAYETVQRAAMETWQGAKSFKDNLCAEPAIAAQLSGDDIDQLCSLEPHLRHVQDTFQRLGL